jgi:hypothetical protein
MERLSSRPGATGGNRWQMRRPRKRLKHSKTVAVSCDRLRPGPHGKEAMPGGWAGGPRSRTPARTLAPPPCRGAVGRGRDVALWPALAIVDRIDPDRRDDTWPLLATNPPDAL